MNTSVSMKPRRVALASSTPTVLLPTPGMPIRVMFLSWVSISLEPLTNAIDALVEVPGSQDRYLFVVAKAQQIGIAGYQAVGMAGKGSTQNWQIVGIPAGSCVHSARINHDALLSKKGHHFLGPWRWDLE